jgi:hydrogenase nickel incorporation protein HypA/HybF
VERIRRAHNPPVHELSFAIALVEAACEKLETLGDVRVEALHVRVGALSGLVKEALTFSFDVATEGTPIAGARLQYEDVPVTVLCARCGERELPGVQSFRCPECQAPSPVVKGREMDLVALEVRDHVADAAHR